MKSLHNSVKNKLIAFKVKNPILLITILLFFVNLAIIVASATISYVVDIFQASRAFNSYWDALFYGIEWLFAPDLTVDVKNSPLFIIGIITSISGMILLSGVVIGIIANSIQGFVESTKQSTGRINVLNHHLIINYNSKVPSIALDVLSNDKNTTIVIASDRDNETVYKDLKNAFDLARKKKLLKNVIVKQINPQNDNELLECGVDKASHILIMDNDDMTEDGKNISSTDMDNIKIVLRISKYNMQGCISCIEVENSQSVEIIDNLVKEIKELQDMQVVPFSYNRKLGQLMAASLFNPKIVQVYEELLSLDGLRIVAHQKQGIEDYLLNNDSGIPIFSDGKLYVADDKEPEKVSKTAETCQQISHFKIKDKYMPPRRKVYVLGTNEKSRYLQDSLRSFIGDGTIEIHHYSFEEEAKMLSDIKNDSCIDEKKTILILSDSSLTEDLIDSNVFLTIFKLNSLVRTCNLSLVVEITNPKNIGMLDFFNLDGYVLSNRIVSFLASQTLYNRANNEFLDILFDPNDKGDNTFDIWVDRADSIISFHDSIEITNHGNFVRDIYLSSNKKVIVLGVYIGKELVFLNKLTATDKITLSEDSEMVFVYYG
ncbi:MAG: hypothetical protein WC366_01525 [Bacilli bacterium]|jgi:hypothetical protein